MSILQPNPQAQELNSAPVKTYHVFHCAACSEDESIREVRRFCMNKRERERETYQLTPPPTLTDEATWRQEAKCRGEHTYHTHNHYSLLLPLSPHSYRELLKRQKSSGPQRSSGQQPQVWMETEVSQSRIATLNAWAGLGCNRPRHASQHALTIPPPTPDITSPLHFHLPHHTNSWRCPGQ